MGFVEEYGRKGMSRAQIEFYFRVTKEIKPELQAKMTTFFSTGLHLAFEEADRDDDVAFFEHAYEAGWIDCLIHWRNVTIHAFEYDNFDCWLREKDSEKFKALIHA